MAIELQLSNGMKLFFLLGLMSSTCSLVGTPSFKLWKWLSYFNRYLYGQVFTLFIVFISFYTKNFEVKCEKKDLREISSKRKTLSVFAYAFLIAIAVLAQIILWKWNYNVKYSFPLFVLSNIIMGSVYMSMLFKTMYYAVGQYKYYNAIEEILFAIICFSNIYIKSNIHGDNWLYHFYFSDIIYICAKEIIALSTGNMWLHIVNNCQTDVSYYSDDEDFEYISSDEEYEIVYKDYQTYQQPKAISL